MSVFVFLSVLAAAVLHAGWNALLKLGDSRYATMLVLSGCQAALGAAIAATVAWPVPEAWPWIVASGVIHAAYQLFLVYAYDHGDLSRVYPLARGSAPMITLVVGALWLGEAISGSETAGILLLGAGILWLARGIWSGGESLRMLPYALGSAVATASYTIVDGIGARTAQGAPAYLAWVFVITGLLFATILISLKGRACLPRAASTWGKGGLAAVASYASYAVAVWAMTVAPIALVAALRETSILFAVLMGWLIFGERMTPAKGLSVALIVAGVVMTRL